MNTSSFCAQRGVALVVGLVMLAAITLIGVFVMSNSRLEWLMTSNSRFQAEAGIRAEAALRDGENAIETASFTPGITPGFYNTATLTGTKDPRKVGNWGNFTTIDAETLVPARYIVEYLKQSCLSDTPPYSTIVLCTHGAVYIWISTYRVWALATDSKGAARIVQSTYRKIDNSHAPVTIGSNTIPANNPPTQPSYLRIHYAIINND